jgi:hypothetical protein
VGAGGEPAEGPAGQGFVSHNVLQVLTFTWTLEAGVLTLEPISTTGDGPIDGFFPDELIVMAHEWVLQG